MYGLLLKDAHYYVLIEQFLAGVVSRGEGVDMVINKRATAAWKAAGKNGEQSVRDWW